VCSISSYCLLYVVQVQTFVVVCITPIWFKEYMFQDTLINPGRFSELVFPKKKNLQSKIFWPYLLYPCYHWYRVTNLPSAFSPMPCTDQMKNKKYHNVGRIPQLKNGRKRQNRCIVCEIVLNINTAEILLHWC
jgi:hypothetical protein